MKYPTHFYAKALSEVVALKKGKGDKEIMENFLALVRKNGDEAHFPQILDEADRMIRKTSGARKIVVESARPIKRSIKTLLKDFLQESDTVEERINPELIAGIRITINDESQFDGSLKGKLDKLFANI